MYMYVYASYKKYSNEIVSRNSAADALHAALQQHTRAAENENFFFFRTSCIYVSDTILHTSYISTRRVYIYDVQNVSRTILTRFDVNVFEFPPYTHTHVYNCTGASRACAHVFSPRRVRPVFQANIETEGDSDVIRSIPDTPEKRKRF